MAKRRNNLQRDDGLGDPLGDFTDVGSFDIIQFLSGDNNTPVDSPADPNRHQQNQMHNQRNAVVQDPQHNMMYQPAPRHSQARLPDSPPNTDISGAGSSGSPSSNSDPPYSPDNFGNYAALQHAQLNNQGLILGVHDLHAGIMMHDQMGQGHPRNNGQPQIASPPAGCFMSPYPPNQPTPSLPQVSPPTNHADSYRMNNDYGSQMLFDMLGASSEGSINSQCSEPTRKRLRPDQESKYMQAMIQGGPTPVSTSPLGAYDENFAPNNQQPVIRFSKFEEDKWCSLYDSEQNLLQLLQVHVVADKGFNYSQSDGCFVNQKKNHFQVTVIIEALDSLPPAFICKDNNLHKLTSFKLAFCGVKAEMPTSEVIIKQSHTDRRPVPHTPVDLKITERKATKVTVPRLHFQDTTLNNQRKNHRPNPDQKYFLLVIRLLATTKEGQDYLVQSYQSERVIVRATNPGSFEPQETEAGWQKGQGNTLYTTNNVAIGGPEIATTANRTDAKLTVHGAIIHSGTMHTPSDIRLKEDIHPKDSNQALENILKLNVVNYSYKPEIAERWGLTEDQRKKTGLIAQELAAVLPDAVHDIGDYLAVDENRLFYETILATKELCRLHGTLENKMDDKVEEISQRITRYARRKKLLGSMASNLSGDTTADGKSVLSLSRTTLASGYGGNKKEKRERCRTGCGRPEPLCSSKLTQGTIVTLVFVMAACLLAMSALYIMDWHNRNYGYHHNTSPTTTIYDDKMNNDHYPSNMIVPFDITGHSGLRSLQPNTPSLLGAYCTGRNCHSYCCSERVTYQSDNSDTEMDGIVTMGGGRKNIVTRSASNSEAPLGKPLQSGVSIYIPLLNMTIDNRFCIDRSCNLKRGRYNLYIPVSPYLPTIPLEFQFDIPRGKVLNNCGYLADFQHKGCILDNDPFQNDHNRIPTAIQLDDVTYELSIGQYLQSAYRFRVGYTTESCYSSEDHMTSGYEEYNLVFYRTCSPVPETTDSSVV